MQLTKAIVSSNENPRYLDFWPYVSKAWKDLIGIEPVLFFTGSLSRVAELSRWGRVIRVEESLEWDTRNQTQSIRLWAGTQFPDDNMIISDLDMLPISREYYRGSVADAAEDSLVSYTSDILNYGFYVKAPQLPMCYLAAKGSTFNEILGISPETSWEQFVKILKAPSWAHGTDQRFFWSCLKRWPGKEGRYIGLSRGWLSWRGGEVAVKRLDKVSWPGDKYQVRDFFDCHLPRPLSENREKCMGLFDKLGLCTEESGSSYGVRPLRDGGGS